MLSFKTNLLSLASGRAIERVQNALETTVRRLSSGLRINSAADDAAGMAIAERMEARGRAINASLRGVNDLYSLVQVAEATLSTIGADLQRIRELAVQAANGTLSAADRQALQSESNALITAARSRQAQAAFNGQKILDGSLQFQDPGAGFDAGLSLNIAPVFFSKTTDELFRFAQYAQVTATIAPSGALAAGDLRINGVAVPASSSGAQAGQAASSAWAIAQAINQSGLSGLTATANATTLSGSSVLPPGGGTVAAGAIVINGVAAGAGNYVNAINAISGQTGVTAVVIAGAAPVGFPANVPYTLVLTAGDGRNIDVSGTSAFGLGDASVQGTVTLTGPLAERPAANLVVAGNNPTAAGFAAGTLSAVDSGEPVALPLDEESGYDQNPNLVTSESASITITLMDRKLGKLLSLQSKLGAVLNTLDLRTRFLQSAGESNAAARSRIVDADYAVEMAELTRQKILQSAGLAMLAQSNVSPVSLMQLLMRNVS